MVSRLFRLCGGFSAAALIILCLHRPVSMAQTTMGTITGVVTDSSHAVLSGATVVAHNTATGVEARTTTSNTGNYVLPSLQIGTYEVTVSQAGFNKWTRSNIALSSGDNIRVDATLTVGQVSQTVEVTSVEAPLKTESTEVSSTMEQKLVQDVPLAVAGIGGGMRNAFSLMIMLPQVRTGDGTVLVGRFQRRRRTTARLEHQRGRAFGRNGLAQSRRLHEPSHPPGRFHSGAPYRDCRFQSGRQPR